MARRFHSDVYRLPHRVAALAAIVWLSALNMGAVVASDTAKSRLAQTTSPPNTSQPDRLPRRLANQVRRELARRLEIPRRQVKIVGYSHQLWSDGCLELAAPGEFCTQAVVPGWRIELVADRQTWVYHTDETGRTLRSQDVSNSPDGATLPERVGDRILEAASQAGGLPKSELELVDAQPRTWDGCFGIASPSGACTQIAISGWQAIVTSKTGSWVYHSNSDGSDVRLNDTASQPSSSIVPAFIPAEEQIYPGTGVIFQAIVEGGLTGTISEILLLEDGQVVQFVDDQGVAMVTELGRVSPQQVQAFEQLLQQQSFSNLNGLSYPAQNAADYQTVTFTARGSTTRYADVAIDQLPSALQEVIQAWEQIVSTDSIDYSSHS